jgi:hypothetical protein
VTAVTAPLPARRTYPDEDHALRRVEVLKKHGIWPAVIRSEPVVLTYDPDIEVK